MIEQRVTGTGKVVVVGHRGALGYAAENTAVSFRKAAALGAHAFELDVHLTRDGEVVVIHDESVDRVSNGSGAVAEMTLAELRRLDFGVSFPDQGRQQMPTLAEALAVGQETGLEVVIEIKGEPEPPMALVRGTVAAIAAAGMVERVAVISFHHPCLAWAREIEPRLATGILFGYGTADPIAAAKTHGANSIRPHHARVTESLAQQAHALGFCLHTWVVNDGDMALRLAQLGVDSFGCDYPDRVRLALEGAGRLA